jgi:hypothetical protein
MRSILLLGIFSFFVTGCAVGMAVSTLEIITVAFLA